MLGGLGLQLVGAGDEGQQRDVYVDDVPSAFFKPHLTDSFKERRSLDISDSSSYLGYQNVRADGVRRRVDALLYLIGDVGNDLHCSAEVISAPFLVYDGLVDLSGGDVAVYGKVLVDEALVMPEVKVGLCAVVGDEDLAVLVGGHRSGVYVDIRVALHHCHLIASVLQQPAERSGGYALAQPGDHAAGDEDVFCFHSALLLHSLNNC